MSDLQLLATSIHAAAQTKDVDAWAKAMDTWSEMGLSMKVGPLFDEVNAVRDSARDFIWNAGSEKSKADFYSALAQLGRALQVNP